MTDSGELDSIREKKRKELLNRTEDGGTGATPSERTAPTEPVHVEGKDHLDRLVAEHGVVLVDYYADWCGPCQMLEPVVADIARETPAVVAKVDVDRHQGLAGSAGVRGVPTLVLYVDGEPAERLVGMQDRDRLADLVARHA